MTILNTSVSGMLADSNWLSSISQNVANANTTGYKNAETDFSTLVDQVSTAAAGGGVMTTTRNLNTLQGNVVSSSTATNLAVQGSGFFVVSDSSGATYLTRNGSFVPDASGNLVNSAGYYLMGNDVQSGSAPPANALSTLQKVNVNSAGETATPTTSASIAANLPASATPIAAADLPSVNSASSTYTDVTSLVVYDNLGGAHTINLYLANTGANTWEVDAFDASKAATGGGFPYSSGPLATATLNFNPTTGSLSSGSPLTIAVPNGQSMSLDLSNLTQLAAAFSVSSATANGNAPASLQGVSIAPDGTLSFNYTNGASIAAYDVPLANVASPDNLTSVNGNAFTANAASGPVYLGTANAGSFGAIDSSSLESSTVDLATELTDMIQAQSAYEANSKVFQTGANILDVLNGLKA
ncbi:MAG: flagellar hook protein FlgE [Roseiarcus sp.]|jgi:flagellar hook protein FlgE|uniref:flagellar hook protein FlgE n=1 Tax=Roseiarcus sp. TaxID=1969460 RepID=UPI003BB018C7